jgi:phosphoribosylanthranilate isomerase
MDVFTMVVVIVAISVGAGVANNYMKLKRLQLHGSSSEEVLSQLDGLRERIRVLEEIVTDPKYHLKAELDRLERSG